MLPLGLDYVKSNVNVMLMVAELNHQHSIPLKVSDGFSAPFCFTDECNNNGVLIDLVFEM